MVNFWKIAFATLVIFGCGLTSGVLLTHRHQSNAVAPSLNSAADPGPSIPGFQLQRVEFLRRMEKHLELTPEQRDRIEKIMHQSQERSKPLLDQIAAQKREELKTVREEIRAELTSEQKKKFETLLKARPPRKEEPVNEEKHRRPQGPQPFEWPAAPGLTN